MHSLMAWLIVLLAGAATEPAPHAYSLEQYMAIKRANDPTFSPDAARIAFASNASGDWQLWMTPTSRWEPRQVTHFAGGVVGRWSPTGKTILGMADIGRLRHRTTAACRRSRTFIPGSTRTSSSSTPGPGPRG